MDINTIWFILIATLFLVYSALDGFDLGIGMIYLFTKNNEIGERKKHFLSNSIAPIWDANEVWLIAGAGGMFAAFPNAYATVFSGFYLAVIVLLLVIIFRAIALEIRSKFESKTWRKSWDCAFGLSSLLIPLLLGVALGNVFYGIPLDQNLDTNISFFALLRPFPVLMGLTVVVMFYLHGSLYAVLKSEGDMQELFKKTLKPITIILAVVYIGFLFAQGMLTKDTAGLNDLGFIHGFIPALVVVLLVGTVFMKKYGLAFIMSILLIAVSWIMLAIRMFPTMIVDLGGVNHITAYNASSSGATLTNMLIIAGIGVPIVIAYKIYVYRVFRGKIKV